MKRAFSIVLALALVLTMMVASAAPAAAVSPGTVTVAFPTAFSNIAGQNATYRIQFHNNELLVAGEYIDVAFPPGTGISHLVLADVTVTLRNLLNPLAWDAHAIQSITLGTRTVRVYIDEFIEKSRWVRVTINNVTNPGSCDYFLQVGTSNVTPEPSSTYTIFSFKFTMVEGKNLFSLPAYPVDTSIQVVLAGLFARVAQTAPTPDPFSFEVWYWDAVAQKWLKYVSDTSFAEITDIEPGKAYWIKVTHDVTFKFKGEDYPECQGPPQKFCWYVPSWNMVGFVSLDTMWASEYLKNAMLPWPHQLSYAVSTIYGFNSTTQKYYDTGWTNVPKTIVPPNQPGDAMLLSGDGYFMSFLADACIIPPIQ